MNTESIPTTFEAWKHCITVKCKIALTPEYIRLRIGVLSDPKHEETKRFRAMYGDEHLKRIVSWFQKASTSL